MSGRLLRRALCGIWHRYRIGILAVAFVLLAAGAISVFRYFGYWESAFAESWALLETVTGENAITALWGTLGLPFLFWSSRWLFSKRGTARTFSQQVRSFYQETIKPTLGVFAFYSIAFVLYMVFAAQPEKYVRDTAETARRTPAGTGESSYQSLARKLSEAENRADTERAGRLQAERERDDNLKQYTAWLKAPTSLPSYGVVDQALGMLKTNRQKISTNKFFSALQRERVVQEQDSGIASLEEIKRKIDHVKPFHPVAAYTAGAFHLEISERAARWGTEARTLNVPTIDWMAKWDWQTNVSIVLSTNCPWKSSCLWCGASVEISISGKKAKPAKALVKLFGTRLQTELNIEGENKLARDCAITDRTNCFSNVDWVLGLS